MRKSSMLLTGILVAAFLIPAQGIFAEVYEAPYYMAPMPEAELATYGGAPGCGAPMNSCPPPMMCDPCQNQGSPASKLGRGVVNFVTGWFELPKHMFLGFFNCGTTPLEGIGVGIARGLGRAIERVGIGLFEVVTFPIPGFDPLLCPEYISLEGNCIAMRNDCYNGGACPPSVTSCLPPCTPCAPMAAPGAGMKQALQRPDSVAMNSQPAMPPAGPARDRTPGSVTYPDDYLK